MNEPTHWSETIKAINASGEWSYARIAEYCECAPSTIGDLAAARTVEPKANTALRLIELHEKVERKTRKDKAKRSRP